MTIARTVANLAGAFLAFAPLVAQAEVAKLDQAGFVITLEAESTADPSTVWKAMIAPGQWWSDEHTYSGKASNLYIDAQATGCFCEKLPVPTDAPAGQRMGSVEHMHVIQADPVHKVLRLSGGLGPLQSEALQGTWTVTLKPLDAGTRIVWEYVVGGYGRLDFAKVAPQVDAVMGAQLAGLNRYLAAAEGAKVEAKAEAGGGLGKDPGG